MIYGLFVGAAVALMDIPGYGTIPGLIQRIHPADHETTDESGQKQVWSGLRPMIDAVFMVEADELVEGAKQRVTRIVTVTNLSHESDIKRRLVFEGKPAQMIMMCPRYGVIASMEVT